MPFDKYCQIIDSAASEKIMKLYLGQLGEPFTDRGIIEKMEYAHRAGMELTSITTNASLLDEEMAKKLLAFPLRSIHFSVDAVTKDIYESIRGLDFMQVEDNVRTFIRLRNEMKRIDLSIRMQMVVYDVNRHQVDAYFEKWKELLTPGLDDIAFLHATNYAGLTDIDYAGDHSSRMLRVPCGRLWHHLIIVAINGDIPICCWDYEVDNKVGNIFEHKSLRGLWNNQRMESFRRLHVRGDYDAIPICRNCNDNYFIKPHFEIKSL